MSHKRKHSLAASGDGDEPVDPADQLMFLCLGGGNEVGRSCHIIRYKGKTVMLDAGLHPAYDGFAALPYYDDFDLSTVDVLLVSHFHLDHAQSLPYVLSKTNFEGRVFMTHPTKAIYRWLIQDSVRVGNTSREQAPLYTEADHQATFPLIEAIDFYTTHTVSGIRFTPYPAGHVLGAAMFLISIAGLNILFTGDYSRENDRHLVPAKVPKNVKIDVLITESTYGIATHIPRVERETALMRNITGTLTKGGRVLMPVFALGRAQELLLILEEYWMRHPEMRQYPIYYASNLARKCMVVYQTYVGAMNDNIKKLYDDDDGTNGNAGEDVKSGPWDFRYVRALKNLDRYDDGGGCVMLASPGMMQSGVSRELLERWAPDPKNTLIITGYSVEGTMAQSIMNEPESIPATMTASKNTVGARRGKDGEAEKVMIPRRMSVQELSFAAHVDGAENKEFIEEVNAPIVILVHGALQNMMRLKSRLISLAASQPAAQRPKIFSPKNGEELHIPFPKPKNVRITGRLAHDLDPKDLAMTTTSNGAGGGGGVIRGVLVQDDYKMSLMAAEDLQEYAGLSTTTVICRQRIVLRAAGSELVRWALEGTFGGVKELRRGEGVKIEDRGTNGEELEDGDETRRFKIMDVITLTHRPSGEIEIEWEGNMVNDGIADAVMAVLFSVESSPAAVKYSARQSHNHNHNHPPNRSNGSTPPNPHAINDPPTRLSRLLLFLEAQFGPSITTISKPPIPPSSQTANLADTDEEREAQELRRLHQAGIPVPGLEIRVDRLVATVWLEDLRVECESEVLKQRVKAVVDRAAGVVAPMWDEGEVGI